MALRNKIAVITLTRPVEDEDNSVPDEQLVHELQLALGRAEGNSKWKVEKVTVLDDP